MCLNLLNSYCLFVVFDSLNLIKGSELIKILLCYKNYEEF